MNPPRRSRPKMQQYGLSASDDGMLDWSWAEERLIASRNYWVATASPEGQPHTAPVWGVWMERGLVFGTSASSRKGRHLSANPRVIAHLESGDEVVIVEGQAALIQDKALLGRMLPLYTAKYGVTPNVDTDPDSIYLRVAPEVVLAWREQDFPTSATRFELA